MAIALENLRFCWTGAPPTLDIPSFQVASGKRVFLHGPSGSGKSTLLGVIAGVLTPQEGSIGVLGEDLARLSAARRDALRAARMGVVFQMFNLLPFLSVEENITLPCRFSTTRREAAMASSGDLRSEARRLLERLGLKPEAVLDKPVRMLSVGQQQRVAVARALIGAPDLIIADEPTSALDAESRTAFLSLLLEECAASGATLLFVSHDVSLSQHFDESLDLRALNRVTPAEAVA